MGRRYTTHPVACHTLSGMARFVIAVAQLAGTAATLTAIAVLIDPWVAVLLGGLLVALGGLGAERAIARR